MKTIGRRDLNHRLAQVLDEVLATGEPVEIVTRGAPPLVLSVKPESVYDEWVRQGVATDRPGDLAVLDSIVPMNDPGVTTEEILAAVRGDR